MCRDRYTRLARSPDSRPRILGDDLYSGRGHCGARPVRRAGRLIVFADILIKRQKRLIKYY